MTLEHFLQMHLYSHEKVPVLFSCVRFQPFLSMFDICPSWTVFSETSNEWGDKSSYNTVISKMIRELSMLWEHR